jgi:hypothetical protein
LGGKTGICINALARLIIPTNVDKVEYSPTGNPRIICYHRQTAEAVPGTDRGVFIIKSDPSEDFVTSTEWQKLSDDVAHRHVRLTMKTCQGFCSPESMRQFIGTMFLVWLTKPKNSLSMIITDFPFSRENVENIRPNATP